MVPPLVQPRLPEFPLGVLMVTLAVPGLVMNAVVSVTCNWELPRTCVLRVVPLITTTEDDTILLPFTVSKNPCCTCANVMVAGEREEMDGAGRALPQRGFRALQALQDKHGEQQRAERSQRSVNSFHTASYTGGARWTGERKNSTTCTRFIDLCAELILIRYFQCCGRRCPPSLLLLRAS